MGTLSQVQHREQIGYPFVVEKVVPDQEYTIDDFIWIGEWYYSGQKVLRVTDYEKLRDGIPILHKLMWRYGMEKMSLFASLDEATRNGFDWHTDDYEICAMNFVGRTEWVFDTHSVFLDPYDVLYVPAGVRHKVNVHSDERLSVSWIRK